MKTEQTSGTTRRQFVTTSALAGASVLVAKPSLVRGSEANSRLKVGMIGLGQRGFLIANMLKEHPGFELVAGCDYFDEPPLAGSATVELPEGPTDIDIELTPGDDWPTVTITFRETAEPAPE